MKRGTNYLILVLLFFACGRSEYEKLVNTELDRNVRYDSLFFGLSLGDSKKDFYQSCWELNKKGIVWQSSDNNYVQHELEPRDSLESPIIMLFYGDFDDNNVMYGMKMKFHYSGWSLWNNKYSADNLMIALKDTFETWYPGNAFIKVEYEQEPRIIWVKIDGNRRISLTARDDKEVLVKMDDLKYKLAQSTSSFEF